MPNVTITDDIMVYLPLNVSIIELGQFQQLSTLVCDHAS